MPTLKILVKCYAILPGKAKLNVRWPLLHPRLEIGLNLQSGYPCSAEGLVYFIVNLPINIFFITQQNMTTIFYQQTMTIDSKPVDNIHKLRSIAIEILSARAPSVIVWDSHLAMQKQYVELCRDQAIPRNDDECDWKCGDANHSGYVVVNHLAKLLLMWVSNFVVNHAL
jgi:hypothetical protein